MVPHSHVEKRTHDTGHLSTPTWRQRKAPLIGHLITGPLDLSGTHASKYSSPVAGAKLSSVNDDLARLASMATTLDELVERIEEVGNQLTGSKRDSLAHDIFEVERSLRTAQRRLNKVIRQA